MAVTISGILKNASGVRPNTQIRLKALTNTSTTTRGSQDTTITTDANGAYSFECNNNQYLIHIVEPGKPYEEPGIIAVYPDSTPASLEDFLVLGLPDDLTPAIVQQVIDARDDAQAAAAAALTSEQNAAQSEQNALTSENAAALSESNASTSESNALSSANAAAQSESNAATSESNASASESNALASANAAALSESNAADSEINAATSESNAADSEELARRWAEGDTPSGQVPSDTRNAEYFALLAEQKANQIFVNGGLFTPTGGQEYPDVSGVSQDTAYIIDLPRGTDYTYTAGPLTGQLVVPGDIILYDLPTAAWSAVEAGLIDALTETQADAIYRRLDTQVPAADVSYDGGTVADELDSIDSRINAGDSQLAGGNIWPADSHESVSTSVPYNNVPPGTLLLRDASLGKLFEMIPVSSGVVTVWNPSDFTATIGGQVVLLSPNTETLSYDQFGAVPDDNLVDNFPFIKKCHEIANAFNKDVVDKSDGIYNIGLLPDNIGAEIETNCDWSRCKFRLTSTTSPDTLYSQKRMFSCLSPTIATLTQGDITLSDFTEGATVLPSISALGYSDVVIAIYSTDKFLERNGDPGQPIYKQELCAVFENGELTSPLQFTYGNISSIEVYKFETKRLELKNLQFVLEDDFKSAIGLYLQRNNTDLKGVSIVELDNVDKNYSRNFVNIFNNYNSVISFALGNGFETGGGTYLLRPELTESCEIRNINAINGWGVFGGNFNKNIKYIDCETNRIDQHALGQDCIVERCNIYDNSGIAVTGKGKLSVRNCNYYVRANGVNLITLRSDYASIWDGEIHLDNIKLIVELENPLQTELRINIIEASILNVDFGTDHVFPDVFVDGIAIDSDASTTLVTCYNLPVNTGVNNQYLPSLAKFHNITTSTPNMRVRAAPSIVADQPKYQGDGMKFDLKNLPMDYNWVHSSDFDITQNRNDAILSFTGAAYGTGIPFPFTATVDGCDNCAFVWTLPTPLKVSRCNGISGMLTRAGNASGFNFPGAQNSVNVYNSTSELMNYRGNQEFMIEDVNVRNVEFIKPSFNSEVGSYRAIKLNTIISGQGNVLRLDCPVVSGDEPLIDQIFDGIKNSTYWRIS